MANRGRPKKNVEAEEIELENNNEFDIPAEQTTQQSDSDIVGDGTFNGYNPFGENVVERDYATPKTASGVVDEIEEPSFVPPSYEDIIQERNQQQENEFAQNNPSPFDNPNPAINELDDREKRIACESLVDTCLDAYEQAHRYAQYFVKVDEEELMQKQAEGKIDLSMEIPVSETQSMSVMEFITQYNEQGANSLKYDREFGYKVRPAMIRVFMKRGWGMTDEQFLLYMLGKDIAIKVGMIYSLKKTINSSIATFEKAHKRNFSQPSNVDVYETTKEREEVYETPTPPQSPPQAVEDVETIDVVEDVENIDDQFTQGMNINMPSGHRDTMSEHPKEIRSQLKKEKGK
jgi:hypothetical protein